MRLNVRLMSGSGAVAAIRAGAIRKTIGSKLDLMRGQFTAYGRECGKRQRAAFRPTGEAARGDPRRAKEKVAGLKPGISGSRLTL
jgi:hypothetical protein